MQYRLIASAALLLAHLASAATPKGSYVLLDQGVASNQKFAILGDLTLDGAGNVAGSEVFRTAVTSLWSSVTGTYTMSSPQSGTLTLTLDQGDGDSAPMTHNYRFLITGDNELLAIRTDSGVFSVCTLSPELVSATEGSFAFSELESNGNGRNLTMLATFWRKNEGVSPCRSMAEVRAGA